MEGPVSGVCQACAWYLKKCEYVFFFFHAEHLFAGVAGRGELAAGDARPVGVPLSLVVVHDPAIVDAGVLWGG